MITHRSNLAVPISSTLVYNHTQDNHLLNISGIRTRAIEIVNVFRWSLVGKRIYNVIRNESNFFYCRMKPKELEHRLSNLKDFERPKIELEQYMTRAHIAAQIMNYANMEFDEIEDRVVLDLGAGSGALSAAAIYVSFITVYKFTEHLSLALTSQKFLRGC